MPNFSFSLVGGDLEAAADLKALNAALKLVRPSRDDASRCRRRIAIDLIRWDASTDGAPTKHAPMALKSLKKKAAQIESALTKFKQVASALPPGSFFDLEMREWNFLSPIVNDLLARCVEIREVKLPPRRSDGKTKRWAARAAYRLMVEFHPVQDFKAAKDSPFVRLAAILYGNKEMDFTRHCRAARDYYSGAMPKPGRE